MPGDCRTIMNAARARSSTGRVADRPTVASSPLYGHQAGKEQRWAAWRSRSGGSCWVRGFRAGSSFVAGAMGGRFGRGGCEE